MSCTAAERILVHLLQLGDVDGHYRRALAHFPFPEISERILSKYFIEGGKSPDQKFKEVPLFSLQPRSDLIELAIAASFAFVWLSKEGHNHPVSVNYLEKIQIGHIYHLTGAMLAGVDFVTMGAGITLQIPGVLDAIASGNNPSYRVYVEGSKTGSKTISFNPRGFLGEKFPRELKRPGFLPIVSTDVLAKLMVTKLPSGSIQGFVVELPVAGGHNAPPRNKGEFDETGQPVYGPKDEVNFSKLLDLGIPFWVGGGLASPFGLAKAQELGAVGIQAGSIFALSEDSGMDPWYRAEMRRLGYNKDLVVRTDPSASPTGFPFKVPQIVGTISDPEIYALRQRNCSRKALQFPAEKSDGKIVLRCSAEPIDDYIRKGGRIEDTRGSRCICNGLFSAAGIGDPREIPIFTMGDDLSFLHHLMNDENSSYTAADAVKYLLPK
ncbi:MAG TPA: nitronate monooxygenase [Candidatus Paceibacterota bacterium]|nr:nitronate monooxygenase [Candidatus Paceibacterota bacterium]